MGVGPFCVYISTWVFRVCCCGGCSGRWVFPSVSYMFNMRGVVVKKFGVCGLLSLHFVELFLYNFFSVSSFPPALNSLL